MPRRKIKMNIFIINLYNFLINVLYLGLAMSISSAKSRGIFNLPDVARKPADFLIKSIKAQSRASYEIDNYYTI